MSYPFDVNEAILWLSELCDLVFVFFDPIGQVKVILVCMTYHAHTPPTLTNTPSLHRYTHTHIHTLKKQILLYNIVRSGFRNL